MVELTRRAFAFAAALAAPLATHAAPRPKARRKPTVPSTTPPLASAPPPPITPPPLKALDIGQGVSLHYAEAGLGAPVVFVHGSLSDYSYWSDQVPAFARERRAIAYSRRYNWPNQNAPVRHYSAITDAEDLAGLIAALNLKGAHIVGHSYGAFAALILAARRPELVRTLVLAEPPAVSLLAHVPGEDAAKGKAMLADIRAHMVAPMRAAFAKGKREDGVASFIDYVSGHPEAWANLPAEAKEAMLRGAGEWDVMLTKGELFPELPPEAVQRIAAPTLLISGGKSYPFLGLIDEALLGLLPHAQRLLLPDAGHQMWLQQPDACRQAALALQKA
jgi:pimeloyl-ACP methyl ester carboxylesterase